LLVTGYCVVAHQQSVGEALNIAACATVLGMVGGPCHCLALPGTSCYDRHDDLRNSALLAQRLK
jgi:hypothetical protein